MNQLRAVFAVGAALLLAVLCGPLASPGAFAQGAQLTSPPPGKALLHIVRSDPEPRDALVPVVVNTELVGYLENGSFTSVAVNPGKVFVRTGEQVIGSFELEAAADQIYYVRVQVVHGTTVVQTDITPMNDAQGRDAVAQARFIPPAPPAPPQARPPGPDLVAAPTTIRQPVYFRFDAGYSMSTGADLKDADFANSGIICGDAACASPGKLNDVGGGLVLGLGIGYRFSESLRGDITFGYRFSRLNDTDASAPATRFKADVSSLTAMANGYYDFGSSRTSALAWASHATGSGRSNSTTAPDLPARFPGDRRQISPRPSWPAWLSRWRAGCSISATATSAWASSRSTPTR
jgi:opacity protein-like surface antigen